MHLSVIILAAGQGRRMRSSLPKVLHPVGPVPMLEHVMRAAQRLAAADIYVVYGHSGEQVRAAFSTYPAKWVEQTEQLGTGHAVAQAVSHIADDHAVLVLYGDVPLIRDATLQRLVAIVHRGAFALLTAEIDDPSGYGRVVRNTRGNVIAIVEHKDADAGQRAVREINTGVMAVKAAQLKRWVAALSNANSQREYYLTDVVAMAVTAGVPVEVVHPVSPEEIMGINDKMQLAASERIYQRRQADYVMEQGVTLRDPARFDLRGDLEIGHDVVIDVNVVCEGRIIMGDAVFIGPNCFLRDVSIGAGTEILANSVIEGAEIGPGCRIGPFARIRPGTLLGAGAHIGNFVEIKKSVIGEASKVNHLSYVGDASLGKRVNVGAGAITCNYDGANKHRTVIEDDVFVGSDTQLIAPLKVGAGATIGAGSTITRDVPPGELTLSRAPQLTRRGWKRPLKKNA